MTADPTLAVIYCGPVRDIIKLWRDKAAQMVNDSDLAAAGQLVGAYVNGCAHGMEWCAKQLEGLVDLAEQQAAGQ